MPLSHRFGCQALEELNTTQFGSFTIILDSFGDWNILEYIGISKKSLTLIQFVRGNWTAMRCIGMDMDVYSTHHKVGWNWHRLVARLVHRDWNHLVVFEVSTSGCLPLEIARLRWLGRGTQVRLNKRRAENCTWPVPKGLVIGWEKVKLTTWAVFKTLCHSSGLS